MTEKIKAVKFWISFLEAAPAGYERPRKSWAEFDGFLTLVARRNADDGGYDKCDYHIKFENDDTYDGRIDIYNSNHYPNGLVCLADEIFSRTAIRAGIWKPAWMDDEFYERMMAIRMPEWEEQCRRFLAEYELPVQDAGFQEVLANHVYIPAEVVELETVSPA